MTNTNATSPDDMKSAIIRAGGSKTIYAFVMPETKAAFNAVLDLDRVALHDMYDEAWTSKQDPMHRAFFETWLNWSAPVVRMAPSAFPFTYPSAGASEVLRETINAYGHRARAEKFKPRIHVFEGEYEGYEAYAKAANIPVVAHKRSEWRSIIETLRPQDQVYLSQPSALDGNIWEDYDPFMQVLAQKQPKTQVILDLTYVGAVARPYNIRADYPNVEAVVFSLSKPMGVYYHRIGGLFSRTEMPSLYGNAWFKNLLALKLGMELMKKHTVHELPKKYQVIQAEAAQRTGKNLGLNLKLSDVWLLATAEPRAGNAVDQFLLRGSNDEAKVRLCLTPMIDRIINTSFAPGAEP
ncbi:MAG: hypothetical protein JWO78_1315 [Micavibrio sp.]|nr:hypothetical protein [Micavibrio sp.]